MKNTFHCVLSTPSFSFSEIEFHLPSNPARTFRAPSFPATADNLARVQGPKQDVVVGVRVEGSSQFPISTLAKTEMCLPRMLRDPWCDLAMP